jgi:hypothetical protein
MPPKGIRRRSRVAAFRLCAAHTSCRFTQPVERQNAAVPKEDGAIMATLDDYRRARRVMAPLFDSVAADGASPEP